MKKLTLLLMACAVAVMGFAAGGNITYELNGGVTNPDGWKNKADMLVTMNADYNTQYSVATTATYYTWETLDVILAAADPVVRIATFTGLPAGPNKMYDLLMTPKWQWLHDHIVATVASQSIVKIAEDETGHAYWRYNVSAFFVNGKRTGWPASADYAIAGQPAAFMPVWKHGFAGPATYDGTAEIVLPAPYKEGFTFDGWYAAADFSGAKVTSIPAGATGDKAFYAKWVEYVPKIAEVWTLGTGGVATKTAGTVSLIVGNDVYIQDATGGMLLSFAAAPGVAVGDNVSVSGKTAPNGTKMKLIDVAVNEKVAGSAPAIQTLTMLELKADATKEYKSYMYEWVQILGLSVKSYNADGTSILADDADLTFPLALKLDQANYPVGTKIDFKGVVDFGTEARLNTVISNIKKSPVPQPDPFAYPVLGDGKYSLTSKWLVSSKMDNIGANPIGTPQYVRGMAAKDGKMYFVDREHKQLTVVDGATGKRLAPIVLASNIFMHTTKDIHGNDSSYVAGTLPFNDIKLDNAGNILLGNCITSNAQPFQVWKIDLATGQGTLVIDEILKTNPDFAELNIRFDAFGVYGDINGNAIIMASNANAMEAYKWEIKGGVAGKATMIEIATDVEGTYLTGLANPGTAPQIFPLDEFFFYLDGNATLPTLIDMSGNIIDGFYKNVPALSDLTTSPGNDWKINQGHNGLIEFELGGEYFFLIAGTNTAGVPPSTFRLYKWKDANKLFSDMVPMWTFPAAGMGAVSNAYRTAIPSVEVNEATKTAKLYVYTGENGYGMYEFSAGTTGIRDTYNNDAVSVTVNGKSLLLNERVASVSVFSVTGQLVAQAQKVQSVKVSEGGIFIVKATTLDGQTAVHKVIVR